MDYPSKFRVICGSQSACRWKRIRYTRKKTVGISFFSLNSEKNIRLKLDISDFNLRILSLSQLFERIYMARIPMLGKKKFMINFPFFLIQLFLDC